MLRLVQLRGILQPQRTNMFHTANRVVNESIKKHGVFPDVIDEFQPRGVLYAEYANGDKVSLGNELKVDTTQDVPNVQLTFNDNPRGNSYTLLITDPDAPRRGDPKWSEFAHFLVSGIKPDVGEGEPFKVDFSKVHELVPYMGPGPPPKTSLHRYVFIVFKEGSTPVKGLPSDARPNWGTGVPGSGVRNWAKGQNLEPVSLNFFLAKNEEQ